jgi:hypothetical protein
MNQIISFPELLRIFKWNSGTQAQAEAELLRRAKIHDELVTTLEKVHAHIVEGEPFSRGITSSALYDLLSRAKAAQ